MADTANTTRIWKRPVFALITLPLLAFLFNMAFLRGGFYADDFFFLNIFGNHPQPFAWWKGLWSIEAYPGFEHLWWFEPGWTASFWRPLPSLIIEGSIRLFGPNPFPLHLLSLLLHAGVTVSLYWLIRRMTGQHLFAFLVGLVFVSCEDHPLTVGWIATITDLLCVQFVLISLLCHLRWLNQRSKPALLASLAALLVAMACKETAAVAPLAIVCMSFLMPTGVDDYNLNPIEVRKRLGRTAKDWVAWLPAAVILIVFLVSYRVLGFGDMNTLLYTNPLTRPVDYLGHLVLHLPIMWLGTFSFWPPFILVVFRDTIPPMAVAGAILFFLWLGALWAFRHRPIALWALVLYLLALLPQVATDASERGLYFPMIFASILIASVLGSIRPLARRIYPDSPVGPRWTRIVGWMGIVIILIPGIIFSTIRPSLMDEAFAQTEKELVTAMPHIEQRQPEDIVILNASGFGPALYSWDILNYHASEPLDVWLLSAAYGVFSLCRDGDSSFVIQTDRHGWVDNWFARVMRTGENLSAGRKYETRIFTATILEMLPDGSDVLSVRFELKRGLHDPGWLFLRWNGKEFEPLDIAALKIGETIELADTSDIWKSF